MREHFAVQLNGKADPSGIIDPSVTAGAYLAHMSATIADQQSVILYVDGQMISDVHQRSTYILHFMLLSMGWLSLLINKVLEANRPESMANQNPYNRRLAYSAAAILYKEIKSFFGKLPKKGIPVQVSVPQSVLKLSEANVS